MEQLIAKWPELSPEHVKLIFIRSKGEEAFVQDKVKEATVEILKEVAEVATCANMSRKAICEHIGNLEKARDYLSAYTQGLMKGYQADEMPKIKARQAKERKEKEAKSPKKKDKADDLIAMAIAAAKVGKIDKPKTTEVKLNKSTCPKCNKEVFSLKFHKC